MDFADFALDEHFAVHIQHVVHFPVVAQAFSQRVVHAILLRHAEIAVHDCQQFGFVLGKLTAGFHEQVDTMMVDIVAGDAVQIIQQEALFFNQIFFGLPISDL